MRYNRKLIKSAIADKSNSYFSAHELYVAVKAAYPAVALCRIPNLEEHTVVAVIEDSGKRVINRIANTIIKIYFQYKFLTGDENPEVKTFRTALGIVKAYSYLLMVGQDQGYIHLTALDNSVYTTVVVEAIED